MGHNYYLRLISHFVPYIRAQKKLSCIRQRSELVQHSVTSSDLSIEADRLPSSMIPPKYLIYYIWIWKFHKYQEHIVGL